MRLAVIRGDLPGPIHLLDLETVSQQNFPIEPRGQELYIGRPTAAEIEAVLGNSTSGAGATIQGSDISGNFPITINSSNDDLKIKTSSSASFTTVLVAQAAYANITTFLAAINAALVAGGVGVTARLGTGSGQRVALESNTKGVNSYVEIDTTGNGSVFDTPAGLTAGARTMPAASAYITALNPVNGTLDVSTTAINAVGASTNSNALSLIPSTRGTHTALAEAIAPRVVETSVAIDSWLVGMISEYRSASFNPDSRRGLPSGAAISVVQDDGSTPFTTTLPTITLISMSVPNAGDITIAGTGLGSFDKKETTVRVTTGANFRTIQQRRIELAGGSVSSTSIVIPASLLSSLGVTLATTVQVQVRQRASTAVSVNFGAVVLSDTLALTETLVIEKNGVVVP